MLRQLTRTIIRPMHVTQRFLSYCTFQTPSLQKYEQGKPLSSHDIWHLGYEAMILERSCPEIEKDIKVIERFQELMISYLAGRRLELYETRYTLKKAQDALNSFKSKKDLGAS